MTGQFVRVWKNAELAGNPILLNVAHIMAMYYEGDTGSRPRPLTILTAVGEDCYTTSPELAYAYEATPHMLLDGPVAPRGWSGV